MNGQANLSAILSEKAKAHRLVLDNLLFPIIEQLACDQILEARYRDHALSGEWKDHRDCHIKPDLVLIYQKLNAKIIRLVRLGSHSELFV